MAKCSACGKFLSNTEAIHCDVCPSTYHRACVALPGGVNVKVPWTCPSCKSKIPRQDNSCTPVKGIAASICTESEPLVGIPADLVLELRALREELSSMRSEVRDCRAEIRECRSEFKVYAAKIETLENRVTSLETRPEIPNTDETVIALKRQIDERDQELLLCDIEISGVPEIREENTFHIIKTLGTKLGVELEERDIVYAERSGPRNRNIIEGTQTRPRNLAVRFTRRALRDQMLRGARVRRVIASGELGLPPGPAGAQVAAGRIYLNERLTQFNKQLFYEARVAARRSNWKYVWTRDGKIYTRKEDGKIVERIRSQNDITKVFAG